jgi:hypothetical protein
VNAHTAPWEVVTGCHHYYTADDCHDGILTTDAATGEQRFTGEVGRYRWTATVILGVPYCSGCDKPITDGLCTSCELIHADLAQLVEVERLSDGWMVA